MPTPSAQTGTYDAVSALQPVAHTSSAGTPPRDPVVSCNSHSFFFPSWFCPFIHKLLSSTSRLCLNNSSSVLACIFNEVGQEPFDVLFSPQTVQTQLAVRLEPCVLHGLLHAHVLQRPPQLNQHPLDWLVVTRVATLPSNSNWLNRRS